MMKGRIKIEDLETWVNGYEVPKKITYLKEKKKKRLESHYDGISCDQQRDQQDL